jgi:IclR family acetate operon transcriptional repressor
LFRTFHQVGDTSPLHATASGRAILAHLSKAEVDDVIARGLDSFGEATITDPTDLRTDLDQVRRQGYAVNCNQHRPGVCAIAAPILETDGRPLAALTVSMPDSRFDPDQLPHLGKQVAAAAAEATARRIG